MESIAREGGTPLVVAEGSRILGAIRLKDVLKENIKERLSHLRMVGIRSVMITGDNPMTAAAIAAEAGIDDFIGQARPEVKLEAIRKYQKEGHLVAMIGDGTNDAPALAQADVAVAMNAGTQAAREAANMVDLDSNPAKLLDIVEIGKQILITRGALTTFSVANDVSKYFAIIACHICGAVSHAEHAEHHASSHAHQRSALGDHLQCHRHPAAHSAGIAGRSATAHDGDCTAAPKSGSSTAWVD